MDGYDLKQIVIFQGYSRNNAVYVNVRLKICIPRMKHDIQDIRRREHSIEIGTSKYGLGCSRSALDVEGSTCY